ncbi:unnamed protein product [Adineta steineri]|uniref:TLDc domain-containing protein n=1 Tax=Adineta steineri TaxID=433720 RepID=A0A814DS57_9BILA|nr:unnamed protein product [Adineta steineri]CAF4018206.1 unnamed protein product [Adineta steineri]
MESNLDSIRDNTKQLRIRFEKVREDIIKKLNECNDYLRLTEKLCDQAIQINGDLENKLANVSNEEKEWQDIKRKLSTTSIRGKVILDVGGSKYTTSVDTLTSEKDTFFTALFSKQWNVERDPNDNSVFIDRNGELFKHILEYLRTDSIPNDVMTNESLRQLLIKEAEYFRLHKLIYILTKPGRKREQEEERFSIDKDFPNTTLLKPEHKVKLNEFYGKSNQKWELIYKTTRDGFTANAFHVRCDNEGPTMTIIRSSNDCIFGGYTSVSWASSEGYQKDKTAFLFTLTNPHNIPPTKYNIKPDRVAYAVHHKSNFGPVFGGGFDIYISDSSSKNNCNYSNFSHSYDDTTGYGIDTFTGAKNFTTSEIEVYKLA